MGVRSLFCKETKNANDRRMGRRHHEVINTADIPYYAFYAQTGAILASLVGVILIISWNVRIARRRATLDILLNEQTHDRVCKIEKGWEYGPMGQPVELRIYEHADNKSGSKPLRACSPRNWKFYLRRKALQGLVSLYFSQRLGSR